MRIKTENNWTLLLEEEYKKNNFFVFYCLFLSFLFFLCFYAVQDYTFLALLLGYQAFASLFASLSFLKIGYLSLNKQNKTFTYFLGLRKLISKKKIISFQAVQCVYVVIHRQTFVSRYYKLSLKLNNKLFPLQIYTFRNSKHALRLARRLSSILEVELKMGDPFSMKKIPKIEVDFD